MSRVWCIRAVAAWAAVVAVAAFPAVSAHGTAAARRHLAPPRDEPVAAPALASVTASPVAVPPAAPVDVTVAAPLLAGRRVDVELGHGGRWYALGSVVLDARGRATTRVVRTAPATYGVRVVVPLPGGVSVATSEASFEVTSRGWGAPGAYRYLHVRRGAPARWNPCAVVTYRVNGADAARLADLREALRRVTHETGVGFRELGRTRQVPGSRGFAYDADVVVAWTDRSRSDLLGGDRAAAGGFEYPAAGSGGRPRIRNGFVVLDAKVVATMPYGFGEGVTHGQVLLHELGHLMGLGHVEAEHQLMRSSVHRVRAALYGAGDLTGLRGIGRRAGCL